MKMAHDPFKLGPAINAIMQSPELAEITTEGDDPVSATHCALSGLLEDINNAIRDMLAASPIEDAEEFAIHDYEGFEGIQISEYSRIDQVAKYAAFVSEHGALGGELIVHYGDIESAQDAMEDHYYGCYASVADFAEELTEQTTQIPESLRFYIDYEAMARDLQINDIVAIKTGFEQIHVFWSH